MKNILLGAGIHEQQGQGHKDQPAGNMYGNKKGSEPQQHKQVQNNVIISIICSCIGERGFCMDELAVDGLAFAVILDHFCLVIQELLPAFLYVDAVRIFLCQADKGSIVGRLADHELMVERG